MVGKPVLVEDLPQFLKFQMVIWLSVMGPWIPPLGIYGTFQHVLIIYFIAKIHMYGDLVQ